MYSGKQSIVSRLQEPAELLNAGRVKDSDWGREHTSYTAQARVWSRFWCSDWFWTVSTTSRVPTPESEPPIHQSSSDQVQVQIQSSSNHYCWSCLRNYSNCRLNSVSQMFREKSGSIFLSGSAPAGNAVCSGPSGNLFSRSGVIRNKLNTDRPNTQLQLLVTDYCCIRVKVAVIKNYLLMNNVINKTVTLILSWQFTV